MEEAFRGMMQCRSPHLRNKDEIMAEHVKRFLDLVSSGVPVREAQIRTLLTDAELGRIVVIASQVMRRHR
jgi:hypothetical protein